MVLRAKGMSEINIKRFQNMYENAEIRVVVNGEIGRAIKVKRCVRQGAPSPILLFLYNIGPIICYLEKRLTGIVLYRMPVAGPVNQDEPPLPPLEDTYRVI